MKYRVGIISLAFGVIFLAIAGTYYGYTFYAGRDLQRLEFQVDLDGETLLGLHAQNTLRSHRTIVERSSLYPGVLMPARQWADPRGAIDLGKGTVLVDFIPLSHLGRPILVGDEYRSTTIEIPSVGIVAWVTELSLIDAGDSISYTTPNMSVGHIPETSNPGSYGNGWFFGHLESPIQKEGNVFAALPRIPELLDEGEDVFIVLAAIGREYLYQVSRTEVVHQDNLQITESEDARITLVTCYPRFKYDHRLVVTAHLVGFREPPAGP